MKYVIQWRSTLDTGGLSRWMPGTDPRTEDGFDSLVEAQRGLWDEVDSSILFGSKQSLIRTVMRTRCMAAQPGDIVTVSTIDHRILEQT